MAKRRVQHIQIDPEWPEYGEIEGAGTPVRLADVEALYSLESDVRGLVFIWRVVEGHRERFYPWRYVDVIEVDDETGDEVLYDMGPDVPRMLRSKLQSLGWTDEKLEAERRRLGLRVEGELLVPGRADSLAVCAVRRAVWDAVTAAHFAGEG